LPETLDNGKRKPTGEAQLFPLRNRQLPDNESQGPAESQGLAFFTNALLVSVPRKAVIAAILASNEHAQLS
jgi:hypothetical protein